jgi:hypothetical protein
VVWFALNDERPLFAFAGIWTMFNGDSGTKSQPVPGPHQVCGFLTTSPNAVVAPIHPSRLICPNAEETNSPRLALRPRTPWRNEQRRSSRYELPPLHLIPHRCEETGAAYQVSMILALLVDLRWEQADFNHAVLQVRRAKKGTPATHPVVGDEMRALRKLQRQQDPKSPFVFTSERGSPFTTAGFARMVERAGVEANLGFPAHPHMLRHACGFALANKGHDTRALQAYLGHRNIQHTVRYTELSPDRFKDFWR